MRKREQRLASEQHEARFTGVAHFQMPCCPTRYFFHPVIHLEWAAVSKESMPKRPGAHTAKQLCPEPTNT